MIKKIIYPLCVIRNKIINRDDFNWNRYHKCYAEEIENCEKVNTLRLSEKDFKVENNKLKFICKPSLHNNAELLYRIIHDLKPKSVFEVGCGWGDHMHNIKLILPKVDVNGCDLLHKQLNFLYIRNSELTSKVFTHDITKGPLNKFDLIYTQAVIMHLQKSNNHIDALNNMIASTDKYVVLLENWTRHDFIEDLKKIELGLKEKLYLYKVDNGKQVALIISKIPIRSKILKYQEVKTDKEMRKYL